jgi:Glycosyl transferase family 2
MTPLFSVVIPTMGRPEFVRDAVASVLLQEGAERDLEVVVSNNGGGEETKHAVDAWREDDRFVYVEPPSELSMPDHWEWASQAARGEYVLILTDRLLLRQGALESLSKLVSTKSRPYVISWPVASYSEISGATSNMGDDIDLIQEYPTRAIWEGLKQGRHFFSPVLPRGLNSCVHRTVYDKIRRTRGRAFDLLTPDYSSAFAVLLSSDVILHHGRPLTVQQGMDVSNGGLMRKGIDTGYMKPLGSRGQMHHVPVRDTGHPLVTAVIYEDFFRTAAAFGCDTRWDEIDPVAFYRDSFREIVVRHVASATWSTSLRQLRRNYADAIKSEGEERSRKIKRELRSSFPWSELLSVALSAWCPPRLLRVIRRTRRRWGRGVTYKSALDAAGFGNRIRPPTSPRGQPAVLTGGTRGIAEPQDLGAGSVR